MLWVVGSWILFGVAGWSLANWRRAFRRSEKPAHIIGTRVILSAFDYCDLDIPQRIEAMVEDFNNGQYRLRLEPAIQIGGRRCEHAMISSRHHGYPISSARRSGWTGVGVDFGKGNYAVAAINRLN